MVTFNIRLSHEHANFRSNCLGYRRRTSFSVWQLAQTLIAEGARVVMNSVSSQTLAEQLATAFPQQVFAYQAVSQIKLK